MPLVKARNGAGSVLILLWWAAEFGLSFECGFYRFFDPIRFAQRLVKSSNVPSIEVELSLSDVTPVLSS